MEKITRDIKKLLDKNERSAKKKKVVEPIAGTGAMSDEDMVNMELKRRKAFAKGGKVKELRSSKKGYSDEDVVTAEALRKRKNQKALYGSNKPKKGGK